jgi:hypothetical protein
MKVGSRVICIDDTNWSSNVNEYFDVLPQKGKVYTVRRIIDDVINPDGPPGIALEEIFGRWSLYEHYLGHEVYEEAHFKMNRFREVFFDELFILEPTEIEMLETTELVVSENTSYINSKLEEIFSYNPILKNKRLKKLNICYPYNEFNHDKIDVVEWDDFIKHETERLPLLVANRARLWPKEIPFDNFFEEKRIAALLHITYLNCVVLGCEVYQLPASFNYKIDFPKDYKTYII